MMPSTAELVDRYFNLMDGLAMATSVTAAPTVAGSGQASADLSLADGIDQFLGISRAAHDRGNKLILIGNGASATMASHFASDFSKNAGIRALAVNDSAMLTALVNDIGPETVFARQIEFYAQAGDVLVAISSSGASPNILVAAAEARKRGCSLITFSGFDPRNPLRQSGDLNFHVPAEEYGFVEVTHTALIHAILDLSLGWGTENDRNPGALKRRAGRRKG
jgi:D-sedoheptulose 7-phosphate isomerase